MLKQPMPPKGWQQYRLISTAIVLSTLAHLGLLYSTYWQTEPTPRLAPVIYANLKAPVTQQPELKVTNSAEPVIASAQPVAINSPTAPKIPPSLAKSRLQPANTNPAAVPPQQSKPHPSAVNIQPAANASAQLGLVQSPDQAAVDPLEQSYQQLLLAHLRSKVSAPAELNGSVRLAIKFNYRQIAAEVQVIRSSGDPRVDDWALKAVLSANPYPPVPTDFPTDYVFRPTLEIAPDR